jgi:C-terminal processing protease CtpA/Prc
MPTHYRDFVPGSAYSQSRSLVAVVLGMLVAACGGGGGDSAPPITPPPATTWTSGVFMPSSNFAAQCAAPRSGIDPSTSQPFPDVQGSTLRENNWLRAWSNELYLWYDEILDRDPGLYATSAYFDLLKTTATTPSGNDKDQFHFTYSTDEWQALSQSGVSSGYGVEWAALSLVPPRNFVVIYTEPGAPASTAPANLVRGATLRRIDGVDFISDNTQAGVDVIVAGLFPEQAGETHTFTVRDLGSNVDRTFQMQSAVVTLTPVRNVITHDTPTGTVGYLLFNDHLATAEQALVDAFTALDAANVDDLVLDLRYNGGGYLVIASQVAYMIAGAAQTAGQVFEEMRFNSKHPSTNPVTGQPLAPSPFATTTVGLSSPTAGDPLPTLDLSRVFVLTGPDTCSASEAIINSLRGIDVEVIQIGSTTCGKPYGFYPEDNCGTTYFSIQFVGVNDQGFGDYTDGFSPANTSSSQGTPVPGCSVADDYTHALGDPVEARFAAALAYRDSPGCPVPSGFAPGLSKPDAERRQPEGRMIKPPWRENRIVER